MRASNAETRRYRPEIISPGPDRRIRSKTTASRPDLVGRGKSARLRVSAVLGFGVLSLDLGHSRYHRVIGRGPLRRRPGDAECRKSVRERLVRVAHGAESLATRT